MKIGKRILGIMLYSCILFGFGFFACIKAEEYFYPGNEQYTEQIKHEKLYQENQDETTLQENLDAISSFQDERTFPQQEIPVAYTQKQALTANTVYVVDSYDRVKDISTTQRVAAPDKYIGLNREQLKQALEEYQESPSLEDLEKGFVSAELVSFSPEKVVIKKNYEKYDGFYLINENNMIVVYDKSMQHKFMNTGIDINALPQDLQLEIIRKKFMETEMDLYHFLESYSS